METREPFHTVAETDRRLEAMDQQFTVELIDSKTGASHGYIGYRFRAPGAQAAADGWNSCRERGDLVAVIKPVFELTVAPEEEASELAKSSELAESIVKSLDSFRETARRVAIERIVSETPATSLLRAHNHLLIKSLKACTRAMDIHRSFCQPWTECRRWDRARELADEVLSKVTG